MPLSGGVFLASAFAAEFFDNRALFIHCDPCMNITTRMHFLYIIQTIMRRVDPSLGHQSCDQGQTKAKSSSPAISCDLLSRLIVNVMPDIAKPRALTLCEVPEVVEFTRPDVVGGAPIDTPPPPPPGGVTVPPGLVVLSPVVGGVRGLGGVGMVPIGGSLVLTSSLSLHHVRSELRLLAMLVLEVESSLESGPEAHELHLSSAVRFSSWSSASTVTLAT